MAGLGKGARAALRLPVRDWAEVISLVTVALLVEIGLHVLRLPTLARLARVPLDLGHQPPAAPMLEPLPDWARRRLELANAVVRHWPGGNTCLRRSLVAGNRLRRLRPSLRVGVARDGRVLQAHAWLEIDGKYFDSGASTYATVMALTQ